MRPTPYEELCCSRWRQEPWACGILLYFRGIGDHISKREASARDSQPSPRSTAPSAPRIATAISRQTSLACLALQGFAYLPAPLQQYVKYVLPGLLCLPLLGRSKQIAVGVKVKILDS